MRTRRRKRRKKPLFIDDAGLSTLLGGAKIGCYNSYYKIFGTEEIPLRLFREEPREASRDIKQAVTQATLALVRRYGEEDQPIVLCRGGIFDPADEELRALGYITQRAVIGNPLQKLLKKHYLNYILQACDINQEAYGSKSLVLDKEFCVAWVAEDFPRRESLVKNKQRVWNRSLKALALELYLNKYAQEGFSHAA
jgi:hypothetical protein